MVLSFVAGRAAIRYYVSHVTEFYLTVYGLTLITVVPHVGKRHHFYPLPISDLNGMLGDHSDALLG